MMKVGRRVGWKWQWWIWIENLSKLRFKKLLLNLKLLDLDDQGLIELGEGLVC